jgi:diguanylate cyclase (GGDEF)-like protein
MDSNPRDHLLHVIEVALAARSVRARLPAELAPAYGASLDRLYRQPNRISLAVFTIIFDLFLFSQIHASPELVPLSAALRLGLFTPAVLAFLAIDRPAAPLPRLTYETTLFALAIMPSIISAIICVRTTSTHSLSDVHATTLILLAIGLILRQRPIAVYFTAAISFTAFLTGLLLTPVIPRSELPSLLLTDLAIAASVTVFGTLLDRRDRLLFLLSYREQLRTEGIALQNKVLRRQVDLDGLTGLANRRCFDTTLAEAWLTAQTDRTDIALIMIDVDHFKLFNDHYGHQGGDDCLRRVAQQLAPTIRGTDLLARYGGEEFAAILPGASLVIAQNVAQRMLGSIAGMAMPHEGAGAGARVSISIGVASLTPEPGSTPASLVELADRCLYAAKRAGRNRISVFDTAFDLIRPSDREAAGWASEVNR